MNTICSGRFDSYPSYNLNKKYERNSCFMIILYCGIGRLNQLFLRYISTEHTKNYFFWANDFANNLLKSTRRFGYRSSLIWIRTSGLLRVFGMYNLMITNWIWFLQILYKCIQIIDSGFVENEFVIVNCVESSSSHGFTFKMWYDLYFILLKGIEKGCEVLVDCGMFIVCAIFKIVLTILILDLFSAGKSDLYKPFSLLAVVWFFLLAVVWLLNFFT